MIALPDAAARPDLEPASTLEREAVARLPPGTPYREIALGDLSMSLSDWYELTRDERTLREAPEIGREALESNDSDAVDHAALTAALAVDTYELFRRTNEPALLDETIVLDWQALALTPADHTNRPRWLNNLSVAYAAPPERTETAPPLDEAVAAASEAGAMTPRASPDRPPQLANLSAALEDVYRREQQDRYFDEAIAVAREAAERADEWSGHDAREAALLGS